MIKSAKKCYGGAKDERNFGNWSWKQVKGCLGCI